MSQYQQQGYTVIENFKSITACQQLQNQAKKIVDRYDFTDISIFTTKEQQRKADDYFLNSGDKIRCFFEEEAVDSQGKLQVERVNAINKLGHAMHQEDPVFRAFSADERLLSICQQIQMNDPRLLQSMYIFKQPKIGGEVNIHQDSTFLYTDPMSCVGFWFALEDATLENGCLWGLPGGHKTPLEKIMKRKTNGNGVEFEILADNQYDEKDFIPLPVKTGTMIMFDGRFPHFSQANRSSKTRHAYTLHAIDGHAEYPKENWLQRADKLAFPRISDLI